MEASADDLSGSFSKKKIDKNHCGSIDICPDLLFATLAAALAGAFLALFTAITMNGKKRRRKRAMEQEEHGFAKTWWETAMDFYWIGAYIFNLYMLH